MAHPDEGSLLRVYIQRRGQGSALAHAIPRSWTEGGTGDRVVYRTWNDRAMQRRPLEKSRDPGHRESEAAPRELGDEALASLCPLQVWGGSTAHTQSKTRGSEAPSVVRQVSCPGAQQGLKAPGDALCQGGAAWSHTKRQFIIHSANVFRVSTEPGAGDKELNK